MVFLRMQYALSLSLQYVGSVDHVTQGTAPMSLHCITLQRKASRKLFIKVTLLLWQVSQGLIFCNKAVIVHSEAWLVARASEGKVGGMERKSI